jgi:histone deacetylase complex regulatory component SIN3
MIPNSMISFIKQLPKAESSFFEKLKASLKDPSWLEDIMKCFYCYVEGIFS